MTKPFIVAELSANHLGDYERAVRLVEAAALAGADAVKLQTWHEMTITDYVIESGPWAGRKLHDLYEEARTPWEWHAPLFDRCRRLGMVGFSSVFDGPSLVFLEDIGCPIYKIASFEITDLPLIERVARTGKPMIISTGMATMEEIEHAAWAADGSPDLTLLKCSSAYPAPISGSNLLGMERLTCIPRCRAFGLSDHTVGIGVAVAAAALGASVIEKHLTLSREDGGPDAGFSADPGEFTQMAMNCRIAAAARGEVRYGPTPAEEPSLIFRRGLYFARDIAAGALIDAADIRAYRPALGLAPWRAAELIGKVALRPVTRGEPVTEDCI